MIINIGSHTFGEYSLRNGDLIAVINVLQYLRHKHNNPNIKFYIPPELIVREDKMCLPQDTGGYHLKFFNYLCENYDYFSLEKGPPQNILPYDHIMLWDFRDNIGDVVSIPNNKQMEEKVVVFPIFDATYNTMRNWPLPLFANILQVCNNNFPNHEKIICIKDQEFIKNIDILDFKISTDFITNIEHILTCEIFIGGDTGSSHFASALDKGPKELIYFYTCRSMVHCLPFYALKGKGSVNTYSTYYNMDLF